MSTSDRGLLRVRLHLDAVHVDLSLPAEIPVAALMPSIIDILAQQHGGNSTALLDSRLDSTPAPFHLSQPGRAALKSSLTLVQNGIQDGNLLIVTRPGTVPAAPYVDDEAVAVSTALGAAARPVTPRAVRLTGAVIAGWSAGVGGVALLRPVIDRTVSEYSGSTPEVAAAVCCAAVLAAMVACRGYREPIAGVTLALLGTGFAVVAGFVAVPGGPGAPNVLLAAMAATVTSTVTIQLARCGTVLLRAIAGLAMLAAATALASLISHAPLHVLASISAVVSLGLLEVSPRAAIVLAGLSPRPPSATDVDDSAPVADHVSAKAIHAQDWLTSLIATLSTWAMLGAVGAVVGVHANAGPALAGFALAAATGAALLLRAGQHTHLVHTLVLVVSGTGSLSAVFIGASAAGVQHLAWICAATATLIAATLVLTFVVPAMTFSPATRRGAELLEHVAPAAAVPLACWFCGVFGAARGLSL